MLWALADSRRCARACAARPSRAAAPPFKPAPAIGATPLAAVPQIERRLTCNHCQPGPNG
eukprot:14670645-Alexandrium_andersonii.AAC.1